MRIVSNDVFDAEIEAYEAELAAAKRAKGGDPDELAERIADAESVLQEAQIQHQILISHVQAGRLTVEMYLEALRGSIIKETALVAILNASNREAEAARLQKRVTIMQEELRLAEENRDELE